MDSQENFSKINWNNKNLDLEISKSRFFNISEIILYIYILIDILYDLDYVNLILLT